MTRSVIIKALESIIPTAEEFGVHRAAATGREKEAFMLGYIQASINMLLGDLRKEESKRKSYETLEEMSVKSDISMLVKSLTGQSV